MSERFTWLGGAVELEAVADDGMVCRFTVDRDGNVASFTVERDTTRFRSDGDEADFDEPGEPGFVGPPITATWLKRFAFERTLHEAKRQTAWWASFDEGSHREIDAIESLPDGRRRGRPSLGETYYADVARRYAEMVERGSPRPTAELAEDLGVSTTTARNHVRRARGLGLLTETYRGKPGGRLTAKALKLLEGESS